MAAVNIVLGIYCFGCALIATFLLVYSVRYLRDVVFQEKEETGLRFVETFVYAAIVFIWLMVGYTVLGLM